MRFSRKKILQFNIPPKFLGGTSQLAPLLLRSELICTFADGEEHQAPRRRLREHNTLFTTMAKSRSFFGLRRGSTKSLTFSVLDGKQITKDRVYGGKNPRTQAQMVQRMVMATASAAYAHMKEIVDHSFEGVTYGAPTMARFVSENAKAIKAAYDAGQETFGFNGFQDRRLMVGSYIMAKGSATPLAATYPVITIADGKLGFLVTVGSGATADTVLSRLGINVGEIATACYLYPKQGDDIGWGFAFIRLIALKGGTTELTTANLGTYFQIESNMDVTASITSGELSMVATPNDIETGVTGGASCGIHSAKVNGVWTRSNAVITIASGADVQLSAEDALATYPVGQSYILNGGEVE